MPYAYGLCNIIIPILVLFFLVSGVRMNYNFGLLCYSTLNIGDEIQSIAAKQLLPRIDQFLDRDCLNSVKSNKRIKVIMNGWFTSKPENWPPSPAIKPLFVSFHIAKRSIDALTSIKSLEYLKRHQPIGCRDHYTRNILLLNGVDAYFSGCLTLTLKNTTNARNDKILLTDLDEDVLCIIPKDILTNSTVMTHSSDKILKTIANRLNSYSPALYKGIKSLNMHSVLYSLHQFARAKESKNQKIKRFEVAENLLRQYAQAKLVITSRIHCALPCVAFGTPVIFVNKNLDDPRFSGLIEYLRSYSNEDFKKEIQTLDIANPQPNPKSIDTLRDNMIKVCNNFLADDT